MATSLITEEERRRALTSTPQSRFQQPPPPRDWQPALMDFLGKLFQDPGGAQQQFRMDPNTGAVGMEGSNFPSPERLPSARPGGFSQQPQRGTVQRQPMEGFTPGSPMQIQMQHWNSMYGQPQQPAPQQQGMPMSMDALAALAGGGEGPAPPSFGGGEQVGRQAQPLGEFNSPGNVEAFTGGDLTGFLSLPEAISFDIPQLNPLNRFSLRPEHVTSALNTELAYRQAQQAANQQQFANRMQQLAVAGGMDERAAQAFSQRLIDEERNIKNQQSQFDLEHGLTPMQSMEKQATISAQLTKYKYDLDLDKMLIEAQLSLKSGELSPVDKDTLGRAWKIVEELRKSMPAVDIFAAIEEGNMEAIFQAMQSGSLQPRTQELIESLPWAIEVLKGMRVIESGADVGIPETSGEQVIDYQDYLRSLQEGK